MERKCTHLGCLGNYWAKGLCSKHYMKGYNKKYTSKAEKKKRKEYNARRSSNASKYNWLKRSASKRGIKVQITLEDYTKLVSGPCDYCGKALPRYGYGIDRKDSQKDYTPDNCVPACKDCNFIKKDIWNHEEMKAAHAAVLEFRSKK